MHPNLPPAKNHRPTVLGHAKPEINGQFEVHALDWAQQNKACQTNIPERIHVFEIIWIKKGKGFLTVDLKDFTLCENTICCLAPGQYRKLKFPNDAQGFYLSLSPEFLYLAESHVDFSLLVAQCKGDWNLPLLRPNGEIETVIEKMYQEYRNYHFLRAEILKGLLKVLMIYLSRQIEPKNHEVLLDKDTQMVRKFMNLLKKHYATKKLVADYADELCVTPNYLNSVIKKISGFPASHHIQQYIILEAKRHALYSDLRMKEIAEILGFDDYAHFSKFFKNYSGSNFSSFKKESLSEV
jgi:AraC family transcriptional regulator, transcriptional activator of pobA